MAQDIFHSMRDWLKLSEQSILSKFGNLNRAKNFGKNDTKCVFLPGTRKDRALLVAHADTVFLDHPNIDPILDGNLIRSGHRIRKLKSDKERNTTILNGGIGIGADDRAGCAILWELKDSGHSLLITNAEEDGCIGASALASSNMIDELQDHQFAIQFDRQGFHDLVFYDVGTEDFQEYCEKITGYRTAEGSYTDIRILCQKICGVNISVGYKNEHTHNEFLSIPWWKNTLNITKNWLSKDLPKFTL